MRKRKIPEKTTFDKYIGQKFGTLTILRIANYRQFDKTWFDCLCDCGANRRMSAYKVVHKTPKGCQKCKNKGENNYQWSGYKEMTGTYLKNLKKCSTNRKGDKSIFTITNEYIWNLYLEQDKKCKFSGIDIYFAKDTYSRGNASLDRIDSSKGYIPGNVQWLDKEINCMKTDFNQERFLELCKLITNNQNNVLEEKKQEENKE